MKGNQYDSLDSLAGTGYRKPKWIGPILAVILVVGLLGVYLDDRTLNRTDSAAEAAAKANGERIADLRRILDRLEDESEANALAAAKAQENADRARGCILLILAQHARRNPGAEIQGDPCAGLILGETMVTPRPTGTTSPPRRTTTTRRPVRRTTTTTTRPPPPPPSTTTTRGRPPCTTTPAGCAPEPPTP